MSHNDTTRLGHLEAVALFATVAAVALTALLEPATAAVESNPAARWLLETVGWTGAGLLAVGTEALLFAGWRELAERGYRRAALVSGAGIATVGVADVVANLVVLQRVGLPATVHAERYAPVVGIVGLGAVVAFVRPDPRGLLSAGRDVTGWLSKPDLSAARSVLLVAMLVLAAVSGAVTFGPLPAADRVSAGSGTVLADFEEGNADGWNLGDGSVTTASAYEGTYSLDLDDDGNNPDYDNNYNGQTNAQFAMYHNGGSATIDVKDGDGGTGANNLARITYDSTGGISICGTGVDSHTTGWIFVNISDTGGSTVDVTIKHDGNTIYSVNDRSTCSGTGASGIEAIGGWGAGFVDFNGYNGISKGVQVDGTITNTDGNPIDGATVELRQSGSVVKSTTTNSTGGYSFSGVSDGDYSIRASASGYQNKSKSITVSGAPLTVDVSVRGQLQGYVTNTNGNPLTSATVGTSNYEDTTNSSGGYALPLTDGSYTVNASESGKQTREADVSVSGATLQNFTLPASGTYIQEFKLDDKTGAFPYEQTVLVIEKRVGQDWEHVKTDGFNSDYKASARLEKGTTYRYIVRNVVGDQRTAELVSSGWAAGPSYMFNPVEIAYGGPTAKLSPEETPTPTATVTGTGTAATPSGTATATATATSSSSGGSSGGGGGGGGSVVDPGADSDDDGTQNWWDTDDDGDGTSDSDDADRDGDGTEDVLSVEGPTVLSTCTTPDGTDGLKIEYYDPKYETTALDYNVTGPNGTVYNGTREFSAPVGYWQGCVGGRLTGNVTDAPADEVAVRGNATKENGSAVPFGTNLAASGASGGFRSFGPTGDPADNPVEQATAFGLTAAGVGLSFLLSRRTNVLENIAPSAPVDPVFAAGSLASLAFGLEFSSGGQVSAAVANGVQRVAPLAGIAGVGLGSYYVYKRFIKGEDVTIVRRGGGGG